MNHKRNSIVTINIICVLALLVTAVPLLILGHYNYPSADDWSLARITHSIIENKGSIIDIFKSIGESIMVWREKGEPRYASVLFASLQPGIWGEHFYRIPPWLMIGSVCVSEILLGAFLLKGEDGSYRKWICPIIIPSLVIQLLCVPYPVETFYWYTGSVNYTFVFGLSNVLLLIFLKLTQNGRSKTKNGVLLFAAIVLGAIIGGNNYATSLSTVCLLASLSIYFFVSNRKAFWRTLPVTLVTTIGLIVCLVAPGNQVRLQDEFGGSTTGALPAIFMSLERTLMNIYSWTSVKIVLMVLLITPFLWKAIKSMKYQFRYPVLFTLFTYGIYASQIVATMYVDGTTGGRRMADILYYAYHMWVLLNAGYWIGWIQHLKGIEERNILNSLKDWMSRKLIIWFLSVGILLTAVMGGTEFRQLSTYRACVWLVKGYAKDYAQAWEERLDVLKDDSVKTVLFDPLPGYEELVFYADFQPGENWINNACEAYYEKDYVGLK